MGFSRQEHWNGLPFPSPGDLPDLGIKPRSPALQADSSLTELCGKSRGQLLRAPETMKWLDQSGNNAQLWRHLVVKVKSNAVKNNYCIGTWNVRSMNQSKLDVLKQEMARLNIHIWGISEIKWRKWENLIQMSIISTTVGKNPLEEMELPSQSTKESKMQYLAQS